MKSLLSLKKYFARHKRKLLWGIVFILLSNITQVYVPIFLKDGIDGLQSNISHSEILYYALLIVGAALLSGFFRFLIRQTIIVVSREIEYDLRQDFWSHLQNLSLRYYQNTSTGDLMAHATNDISAVRMFVGPAVMYSIDTSTKMIMIIAIITTFDWQLTIAALLPLPFLSYMVYKLSKKIHIKFEKIQEKFSELTTKAQESFSGIRVIKSYLREESEIKLFEKLSKDYLDKTMDKVKVQAWFAPLLFMITGLSIIIAIWFGGMKVIEQSLTLGELSAFIVYLGLLIWPVIAFGWVLNIIQQSSASMKRLNVIMSVKKEISDSEETDYFVKEIKGTVEFKNVSFRYGENLPVVLDKINIKIDQGDTVAFIGKTGVGKTTLLNLIPRLYDVTEGEVLIDGKNVKTIPVDVIRSSVGLVPQETFLFSDTLENNILYGVKEKDESILERVADISEIKKDVDDFPKKYQTILGERGLTLSGGQKQRTCLARALAVNPKILILDDSFSAVDTHTEEEILRKLKNFMENRTSIIVSHRISTVKDSDKIFVIDNGKIAEEGTHEELIELNGIYADIHQRQLLEEELKQI
ncbi:MAG: ABC transporter ATP-binding protein/permease [Melioribacteraceae bacterium]|nr:ABC transporter ATP-binding protein/permease [Melioribacteraceae bacterium]